MKFSFRAPLWPLSPMCVSRISVYCGTKTAAFSSDFGVEPNLLYFPGISVCCGTKTAVFPGVLVCCRTTTAVFSRDLGPKRLCFPGFWSSWCQSYCILQGLRPHNARTTVFSKDFKSSWCQNYCILQGCGHHRTKTTVFSKDFSPQKQSLR